MDTSTNTDRQKDLQRRAVKTRQLEETLTAAGWGPILEQRRFHLYRAYGGDKKPIGLDGTLLKSHGRPGRQWALGRVLEAFRAGKGAGIGVQLGTVDGITLTGVDIDHCYPGPKATAPAEWAVALAELAHQAGYTERSISGTGLHHIAIGAKPLEVLECKQGGLGPDKLGAVEVYDKSRYFTLSGMREGTAPLGEDTAAVEYACEHFLRRPDPTPGSRARRSEPLEDPPAADIPDDELISRIQRSQQGVKFTLLWKGDTSGYPSNSEADMALCNILAGWTGCDPERMDRLFRQSGLMRDKWDSARSGSTYGEFHIQKAISECKWVYDPQAYRQAQAAADFALVGLPVEQQINPFESTESRRLYWGDHITWGQHFAEVFQNTARFAADVGLWFVFDGTRWAQDKSCAQVDKLTKSWHAYIKACASYHAAEAAEPQDDEENIRKLLCKLARNQERANVLQSARSVFPFMTNSLDLDRLVYNCLNGTIDLKSDGTHNYREHRPSDMISQRGGAVYAPEATCPRWGAFIDEITDGDKTLAWYLQKWAGYSLSGLTAEKKCLFVLGKRTNNGKSVFVSALLNVMGDYGRVLQPSSFEKAHFAKGGNGPTPDHAALYGARLVSVPEADRSIRLDSGFIKQVTGGEDPLTARSVYRDPITFRPFCKLWFHCNTLPNTTDDTFFARGTPKVAPFPRSFSDDEQDHSLGDLFTSVDAAPAILNWMLEGWRGYCAEGLRNEPLCVQAAGKEYREDSDIIGQFVADRLEAAEDARVDLAAVYYLYREWCRENGFEPLSSKKLRPELERLQIPVRRGRAGNIVFGYKVKTVAPAEFRREEYSPL